MLFHGYESFPVIPNSDAMLRKSCRVYSETRRNIQRKLCEESLGTRAHKVIIWEPTMRGFSEQDIEHYHVLVTLYKKRYSSDKK